MLQDIILKGSTDRSVTLRALDADGQPVTSIAYNSAGIDLWYRRELSARVAITEATLAALTTAHTDGGFLHISDGYCRLDLPDAAFATGANYVEFGGTATGVVFIGGKIKLVDVNLEDSVRMGMTALPNAAAEAAGGLYTRGTGAGQINQAANGQINANTTHVAGTAQTARDLGASVLLSSGTGTGQVSLTSGVVTSHVFSMGANVMTASALATDAVNEIQSGLATAAALATVDGIVDDILVDTAEIGAAGAGLTALASAANLATVDGIVDTILVTTNKLDDTLELDGSDYRFTTNALEQAPSGGGSSPDVLATGTAVAVANGNIELAGGHGIGDTSVYVLITNGSNKGQGRMATYSGTGNVFNVDPAWNATVNGNAESTPSGTPTYAVLAYSPAGTANLPQVDVVELGGDAQSLTDLKDFADAGYDPSTNKVQGVVLTDTVTTYTGNTPQTGDAFARIGAPAGASVSADIAAIEAQTDDIGAAGAGLTAIPWNASWDAQVESEVADALTAFGVPTLTQINSTRYLKNTADQRVYFTLVDSTDHVTRETGITVTAERSIDAGTSFASATGSVTEVANGVYFLTTSQADTNADDIIFRFTGTGCDPVEIHVVTAS